MLNAVILQGRLVRDPEVRYTQAGDMVASFSLAVESDYKGRDDSRNVDYVDVFAWKKTAEFVSKYFAKGKLVIVSGKLQARVYVNKDGNKRKAVEVVADKVYFGESKRQEDAGAQVTGIQPEDDYDPLGDDDEDLPF